MAVYDNPQAVHMPQAIGQKHAPMGKGGQPAKVTKAARKGGKKTQRKGK
jgi:hypothetical protein